MLSPVCIQIQVTTGLCNLGNMCFLNATIQMLRSAFVVRKTIESHTKQHKRTGIMQPSSTKEALNCWVWHCLHWKWHKLFSAACFSHFSICLDAVALEAGRTSVCCIIWASDIINGDNCFRLIWYCWIGIWHLFFGITSDFQDPWENRPLTVYCQN